MRLHVAAPSAMCMPAQAACHCIKHPFVAVILCHFCHCVVGFEVSVPICMIQEQQQLGEAQLTSNDDMAAGTDNDEADEASEDDADDMSAPESGTTVSRRTSGRASSKPSSENAYIEITDDDDEDEGTKKSAKQAKQSTDEDFEMEEDIADEGQDLKGVELEKIMAMKTQNGQTQYLCKFKGGIHHEGSCMHASEVPFAERSAEA